VRMLGQGVQTPVFARVFRQLGGHLARNPPGDNPD
jgi:hypothetical protein